MKYYKLVGYKPFWTTINNTYCETHIEEIVKESEGVEWEELKRPVIQMVDMFHLTIISEYSDDSFAFNYLKLTDNEINYYYKLETIHSIMSNGKNNKFQYALSFVLDEYQTIYLDKLNILKEKNPQVYFIRKYCNRVLTKEKIDEDGNTKLVSDGLNYITQRNLSQTLPVDYISVRNSAWDGCSCQELLEWNYPDVAQWEDDKMIGIVYNEFVPSTAVWNCPWKYFKEPNERGRYRYLVCKSSALLSPQSKTDQKLTPVSTTQRILLIPFLNNFKWITQGINDIDITVPQEWGAISPLGDNFIGIFECDLPYAILYAEGLKSKWTNVWMHFTTNISTHTGKDGDFNRDLDIPYFSVNVNYTFDILIKDHDKLLKKLKECEYFAANSNYKWSPDSEPCLLGSAFYKTMINNGGDGLFINTADNIKLPASTDYKKFYLRIRPLFDDTLSIAIDYGNYTNYNNIKFDNTNTNVFDYSIKNSFMGSAAANYYSSNVTTALTGIQNLKNQQAQDWGDFGFDSATKAISAASKMKFNILHPIKSMIGNAATVASAGLSIAKQAYDTSMSHQRENNSLYSQINNTTQAPNLNMGKPFIKGYIENPYVASSLDPTKKTYGLFVQYEIEPQEQDKVKIFNDILNYGYIYNAWGNFNEYNNRVYMNILNIDCDKSFNNIMHALKDQKGPFNNKSFNQMFINWLNESNKLYKTTTYINVTDYKAKDYISNYERIWTNL